MKDFIVGIYIATAGLAVVGIMCVEPWAYLIVTGPFFVMFLIVAIFNSGNLGAPLLIFESVQTPVQKPVTDKLANNVIDFGIGYLVVRIFSKLL